MSFFVSKQQTGPSQLEIAKMEAEIVSEVYNKMTKSCFSKCIGKFNEPDLQIGEMTCTDRCVGKYMQASEKVAETLKRFEEMSKAQQENTEAIKARMK